MSGVVTLNDSPRRAFADDDSCDVARLVAAAKRGDRAAFARLHAEFAPMIHAVLLNRLPTSDADDLVQSVFVIAMEKLELLRSNESFGSWLVAVARRCAAQHLRDRKPRIEIPDDLPTQPRQDVDRAEARRALDAIRALPEAYAEILIMRLVEGMTGPQIAAWTGMTHGSVRVNLHRGMKLLRKRLGESSTPLIPAQSRERQEGDHDR